MFRPFFTSKETAFDEQRIKLITHLSMMVIVGTLAYWLLDLIVVTVVPNFIFIACLGVGMITLILNKRGYHRGAAIFGLIVFNLAMYSLVYLTMMKGRVKILDKFITDIINYSRNSRTELNLEKVDLHFLVNETVDGLKFTEGLDQISFRVGIEPNSVIVTDTTRLKIVLNNLVANAIRYHDKFKSEKFIQVDLEKKEKKVAIHISDNGQGILAEHQEKIFNMFYKASSNSTGSGLGLYIAMETIGKLGGDISVTSEHGKSSTFLIILPA